jgi:hypothetical protein
VSNSIKGAAVRKTKAVQLKGKPGTWVALDPRSYCKVAEGRTLAATVRRAAEAGVVDAIFSRIPKDSYALVL